LAGAAVNRNGIPVGKKTYISNKIAASWEKRDNIRIYNPHKDIEEI
jgi:hypothetical protein